MPFGEMSTVVKLSQTGGDMWESQAGVGSSEWSVKDTPGSGLVVEEWANELRRDWFGGRALVHDQMVSRTNAGAKRSRSQQLDPSNRLV